MGHSHDTGHIIFLQTMFLFAEISNQVAPVFVVLKTNIIFKYKVRERKDFLVNYRVIVCNSGIFRDKTKDNNLIYIPNDDKKIYLM